MNLTEALLHALKERGAKEVYGIPGDFALPYFKIIESSGILPLVTLSHEPAVGFAADASARFRGGLGVAAVTYGAGALNMVNAIAQAYAEKSPVVVISGAPGTQEGGRGLLLHHQAKHLDSQYRMFKEVTCDQAVLDDPATAHETIARVLQSCIEHSRPVYLEIPRDLPAAPCAPVPPYSSTPVDVDAVTACAQDVLGRLQAAALPMMMVGVEVRRYGIEDKVATLAERLGVPVVTSFMGRGLLAGASCLEGTYLGIAGDEALSEAVESSDGLLLLGVIMSDTNFGVSGSQLDRRRVMHVEDRQVRVGFHVYHDIPLDALVDRLLELLAEEQGDDMIPLPEDVENALQSASFAANPRGFMADAADITPTDIAALLNDFFAQKGVMPVASDMGDCLFTMLSVDAVPMVAPGYYASMGFGVPAGMGLQITTGERSIILVGDGAFQMTGLELGNCPRLGIDPIVLVLNNASWEMLHVFQPETQYNNLGEWNFAAMADALGGRGYKVETRAELARALTNAYEERGRFQLIDARLTPHSLSPTLARFVEGVRRFSSNN
ncbi:indolepyruvate/phenylpyruvate decarboxylase [Oleidesulfovibrio sp.]|uniref:indolepyruvate/phenylpyruvate decarboxylase n=1 Tax=Oleidesulfovibrio sp. TaxID=2909707 RepID=UPI003A83E30F